MGILALPLLSELSNGVLGSKSPTTVVAPATDIEMMKSKSKSKSGVVGLWLEWLEGEGGRHSDFIVCTWA